MKEKRANFPYGCNITKHSKPIASRPPPSLRRRSCLYYVTLFFFLPFPSRCTGFPSPAASALIDQPWLLDCSCNGYVILRSLVSRPHPSVDLADQPVMGHSSRELQHPWLQRCFSEAPCSTRGRRMPNTQRTMSVHRVWGGAKDDDPISRLLTSYVCRPRSPSTTTTTCRLLRRCP